MPIYSVEKPRVQKHAGKRLTAATSFPSRKYFSNTAIPQLYSKVRETVVNELQSAKFFSSTTDMWSSQGSATIHELHCSFCQQFMGIHKSKLGNLLLTCRPHRSKHC